MGPDLLQASECVGGEFIARAVPFDVLEKEYISRGCDSGGVLSCEPAGVISHEARVGSTLAANMLAVLPHTLVYAESSVPHELAGDPLPLPASEAERVIRVVIAALGRPIAAAAAGVSPGRNPWPSGPSLPDRFFLKLQVHHTVNTLALVALWDLAPPSLRNVQSSLSSGLSLLSAAFPAMPWLFLHREPVEVLASLLRGEALALPAQGASRGLGITTER